MGSGRDAGGDQENALIRGLTMTRKSPGKMLCMRNEVSGAFGAIAPLDAPPSVAPGSSGCRARLTRNVDFCCGVRVAATLPSKINSPESEPPGKSVREMLSRL